MGWKRDDILAYRGRDWGAFERQPVDLAPGQAERLAGSLYDQVRAAVPTWPTAADRREDLEAHIRVTRLLSRFHRVQCSRPNTRKTLAGRPKDLDDVAGIIRAKPEGLDLDQARRLLGALEEALGQSDLVPWLETAVAKAKR